MSISQIRTLQSCFVTRLEEPSLHRVAPDPVHLLASVSLQKALRQTRAFLLPSSVALSPPISRASHGQPPADLCHVQGPDTRGGGPGLRTLPRLIRGGRTRPPSRRTLASSAQKAGLLRPGASAPCPPVR